MVYCNPVPIASACLLGQDVVADVLNSIFLAIIDLVKYGKDINLAFGFCNVRMTGKSMNTVFSENFKETLLNKNFEQSMKRSVSPVSSLWRTSYTKTFAQSTLGTLIQKPNPDLVQTLNDKTMALKLMSLDLSSSSKFTGTNRFSTLR